MNLVAHNKCSGCTACYTACPHRAISMVPDAEGFLYPQIDKERCIQCGLCEKVCPSLHIGISRKPLAVYAVKAIDEELRKESSSGGVFTLLARKVFNNTGVVFGAAYDRNDWHVYHRYVEDESGLEELRGSKYVQSNLGESLKLVKDFLLKGRIVLFSGTPCQIAALNKYLEMSKKSLLDRLITVEVVCHAVPSPLVWAKYIEKRIIAVNKENESEDIHIRRISSRCKHCGWKRFAMSLTFDNDMAYLACFDEDPFMRGFLAELYNRPSCYNCSSRELRSGADLTIADYWNVQQRFPDMDDDKGVSLVMVNTEKGKWLFDGESSEIEIRLSDFEHACETNPAIFRSSKPHRNRSCFFKDVRRFDFDTLIGRCLRPSLIQKSKRLARWVLYKVGIHK